MTPAILNPVASVEPLPGYRILVRWRAGGQDIVDFSRPIANGPAWEPLRDVRLFNQVRVTPNGHVIEWPEPISSLGFGDPEITVDGDGLWHLAREQAAAQAAE